MSTISELLKEKENLNSKIEELRKNCDHSKYEVKLVFCERASVRIKRFCNDCLTVVEGITEEERAKYIENYKLKKLKIFKESECTHDDTMFFEESIDNLKDSHYFIIYCKECCQHRPATDEEIENTKTKIETH